jgi:hypothetical protein
MFRLDEEARCQLWL